MAKLNIGILPASSIAMPQRHVAVGRGRQVGGSSELQSRWGVRRQQACLDLSGFSSRRGQRCGQWYEAPSWRGRCCDRRSSDHRVPAVAEGPNAAKDPTAGTADLVLCSLPTIRASTTSYAASSRHTSTATTSATPISTTAATTATTTPPPLSYLPCLVFVHQWQKQLQSFQK
ncbi:unnamed protein product [Closterium sp. Naga37s-1]|nr:unnamed protein product [Closterium sp. Naga37s-1]